MKILFTHGYFLYEDDKEKRIMKPYPPLGLQYISAYLEENGYDNDIYDTTFSSFEQMTNYLDDSRPDLTGIYTNLLTKLNVLRIIGHVRSSPALAHTRIVLGGPEVKHHCEHFLDHGADIVVFGEGEATMLDLVQHFDHGGTMELDHIPGIAFRDGHGETVRTNQRPLIKDIDELPLPNRRKIDLEKYFDTWRMNHGHSMISVSTMRGCPYGCKWCSRAVYGKSYRRRSAEKVVDELAWLQQNYDFDRIWFVDDVFTINHRWLRNFTAEIKRRELDISYEIITRADRMSEEVVAMLRHSGCFRVWIGAESGSQSILDAMNRMVTIEKVAEMIGLTKHYGMEAGTFIMLGYPGETEKDIRATLDYLRHANPDHFTMTVAYPIKGTPFYQEVEADFLTDLPWEESTDRDIDFRRTYPRRYYDHAMSWILREMAARRQRRRGEMSAALWTKLAAWRSRMRMMMERIGGALKFKMPKKKLKILNWHGSL
jgi:anaerobic magnesium-protoporphyrin IX monomethyl ester cyclase